MGSGGGRSRGRAGTAMMCACLLLMSISAMGDGLPWLGEAQTAPAELPADAPRLTPVLADAAGTPVRTRRAWQTRQRRLRELWLDYMGRFPERRPELRAEVLAEETVDGVARRLVRYQTDSGVFTEAYLLHPEEPRGRLPGVVVVHSTVDYTIRQPAGVEGPEAKHIGLHLAQRGFVAICPRCFIWDYGGKQWGEALALLRERHPDWRGMAKMTWDAMRAADYLESLPFVAKRRLGCIGHSLGGKETLFAAAFDKRFRAAVSSEGGIGLSFSNWEAEWYLGPQIREAGFPRENHEVLALVAPRPFLLIGGDSADGARSWPFIEAVLPVYRLLGAADRVGLLNHGQGHAFPDIAQQRAYEWLEYWLERE